MMINTHFEAVKIMFTSSDEGQFVECRNVGNDIEERQRQRRRNDHDVVFTSPKRKERKSI